MRIANTTASPLGLTPEHMVPPHGEADVPEDVVKAARQSAAVAWWIETGALVVRERAVEQAEAPREAPRRSSRRRG